MTPLQRLVWRRRVRNARGGRRAVQPPVRTPETVPADEPALDRRNLPVTLLGFVVACVALGALIGWVATVGFDARQGLPVTTLVLTAGGLLGAVMVGLGLTRLHLLVAVLLLLRASIDILKGSTAVEPTEAVSAAFVAAGMLWLVSTVRVDRRPPSLAGIGGVLLIGAGVLSTLGSPTPAASAVELARIASIVMMLVVLERLLDTPRKRLVVVLAGLASLVGPAAVTALQALGQAPRPGGDFERLQGTFVHPSSLAMYAMFLLVMSSALVLRAERTAVRVAAAAAAAVSGVCLLVTYTRGAWIAAFVALLVVALLENRKLALGLIGVVIAVVVLVPSVQSRFADLAEPERPSGAPGNSLVWRVGQWDQALDLGVENRVTGVGLTGVRRASDLQAHNDYVRVLVEMGVAGTIAYAILLVGMVRVTWRARRRAATPDDRAIAAGALGCVVALLVMSVSDNLISQAAVMWYLAAFVGAASAMTMPERPALDESRYVLAA